MMRWKSWDVSDGKTTLRVSTVFSGENGWTDWSVSGPEGTMRISTKFSGSGAWRDWSISDNMPKVNYLLKFAAIFPCIYTGAVRIRR